MVLVGGGVELVEEDAQGELVAEFGMAGDALVLVEAGVGVDAAESRHVGAGHAEEASGLYCLHCCVEEGGRRAVGVHVHDVPGPSRGVHRVAGILVPHLA